MSQVVGFLSKDNYLWEVSLYINDYHFYLHAYS